MITKAELVAAVPPQSRKDITDLFVAQLNSRLESGEFSDDTRENFITFSSVMATGKYKVDQYVDAVKYVSHRLRGFTNKESYIHTFPQRYASAVARGVSTTDIASLISSYSKNKLVTSILEQAHIPSWLMNQEAYQKAVDVQTTLMLTAQSETVRMKAADSLLTHLARPSEIIATVNVETHVDSGLTAMQDLITKLAQQQLQAIHAGATAKSMAEMNIFEGECSDGTN